MRRGKTAKLKEVRQETWKKRRVWKTRENRQDVRGEEQKKGLDEMSQEERSEEMRWKDVRQGVKMREEIK